MELRGRRGAWQYKRPGHTVDAWRGDMHVIMKFRTHLCIRLLILPLRMLRIVLLRRPLLDSLVGEHCPAKRI